MIGTAMLLVAPVIALVGNAPMSQIHAPASPTCASVLVAPNRDWIAKTSDNICGLRELGQVSNPAVVNYKTLLEATPEMRKIKNDKIEANSPEGIRLATNAETRVAEKCEEVRAALGYCSIWKEIKHRDGRSIDEVTEKVKIRL